MCRIATILKDLEMVNGHVKHIDADIILAREKPFQESNVCAIAILSIRAAGFLNHTRMV